MWSYTGSFKILISILDLSWNVSPFLHLCVHFTFGGSFILQLSIFIIATLYSSYLNYASCIAVRVYSAGRIPNQVHLPLPVIWVTRIIFTRVPLKYIEFELCSSLCSSGTSFSWFLKLWLILFPLKSISNLWRY